MKPVQAVTLGTIYRSMVHVIPNAGQDSFQILMEYARNAIIHAKAAMVLDLTNVLIAAHMDSTGKMIPHPNCYMMDYVSLVILALNHHHPLISL